MGGTFDDCQRLVKQAFLDPQLSEALFLSSANSINVGRLLPQMVYYAHGVTQLPAGAPAPVCAVPSGNFGNLTAGLLAKRLGLGLARFVAATNTNDVVPEFLETGLYRPRPSIETLSNAMDVGDPSNFTRLAALYGGDVDAMRCDVVGARYSDDATRRTIREVYERTGYVLDPHTAVGYLGLREVAGVGETHREAPGLVLATAHPVKFREHVEPLIGRPIPVPERLAHCLDSPSRARPIEPEIAALRHVLLATR